MGQPSHEILKEAVARHRAAVLSVPQAKKFEHHKSRFLGEDEKGLWIAGVPDLAKVIDETIVTRALVAVAFKAGPNKAMFATKVLKRDAAYPLTGTIGTEAILLAVPEQVEGIQRRASYRVEVTAAVEAGELSARVWRVAEHALLNERPAPEDELAISVRDLSTTGIGIYCAPQDGRPIGIGAEQRLRVSLRFKGIEVSADGQVRYAQVAEAGVTRVGVLFVPFEQADLERHRLSKTDLIVGALRKEEMRRLRGQLLGGATAHSPAA